MAALIEEKENTNVSATPSFKNPVPSNTPVPTTETISSASLKAQPQVKFPETKPNIQMTAAESLVQGTGDSMINQLRAETAAKTEAAKGNYTNSLDQYIAQLGNQKGFSGFLAEEEKKAGIQALASEAAELEGQINSERLSRAELRTRLDQKGGGLKSGADAEFQNFARDSLFRETNAVIQLGVRSGQLAAAKASAQRVAEAYYEQERNALSARKELVDLNKEMFDKEEQRSFNIEYESAVRELKKQEEELKLTQMTKIDALKMAQMNGASAEIIQAIQNAETPEEVIKAGGQFGNVDMLERAVLREQLNKLREKPEVLAPTSVIDQNGRKLLINTQTGEVIKDFGTSDVSTDELRKEVQKTQIAQLNDLKSHKGFNSVVGPNPFARIAIGDAFTGAPESFIGGVDQLTKGLTIDNLIKAKEEGATFGALNIEELKLISDSASKINTWRVEDNGRTSHYDASQKDFMVELDTIHNFKKLDAYLKGIPAEEIGLVVTADGKIWSKNGDGSLTLIR